MAQLRIPDDWAGPPDGYCLVWFCIPNSQQWRILTRGKIQELTRGRAWDATTGNIKATQAIAWEIVDSVCMANCDDIVIQLTRIADALEGVEQNTQTATLEDLLTDLGQGDIPLADLADLAEVLTFLKDILPNFPNLRLPVGDMLQAFATWRFRQSIINLVEDIAISQRVQATAQFGTSGHSIYELVGEHAEKLLLPAGWAGKAVWLWNRVKPTEIPSWVSWVTDITALLLGNIRSALYGIKSDLETHNQIQNAIEDVLGGDFEP